MHTGNFVLKVDKGVTERQVGEITANYNMDSYSGLDWYLSQGFVPKERTARWDKGKDVFTLDSSSERDYDTDKRLWDGIKHEQSRSEQWKARKQKEADETKK